MVDVGAALLAAASMALSLPAAAWVLLDALRTRRAVQMLPAPNGRALVARHYLRAALFRVGILSTAFAKTIVLLAVLLPLEGPLPPVARVFVFALTAQHLFIAADAWLFAVERRALFRASGR